MILSLVSLAFGFPKFEIQISNWKQTFTLTDDIPIMESFILSLKLTPSYDFYLL